jgi:hypothetical protein
MVNPPVRDAGLTIFVARGELTPADVLAAYEIFLRRGPTRLVLWDVSAASVASVPAEDVRILAGQLARMGMAQPNHGKTAMVCGNAVTYGMARMLGTFLEIEGFPGRVGAFRDLRTARAWLDEGGR